MNNKRLLVLGIALILTAMIVGVAFADNDEYEYTVEVYYNERVGTTIPAKYVLKSVKYTFWAASASEAIAIATDRCTREYGEVASCGGAIPTGRKRPAN